MISVLIWRSGIGPISTFKHPGHAALAISNGSTATTYISFWPAPRVANQPTPPFQALRGRPAAFHTPTQDLTGELGVRARERLNGGASARPGQVNTGTLHLDGFQLANPNNHWVKMPDQQIEIPAVDDIMMREDLGTPTTLGLSEENIADWWRIFAARDFGYTHRYTFISNEANCASIVMAALLAGGSRMYVRPDRALLYYTPNDVCAYATKLRNRILDVNRTAQAAGNEVRRNASRLVPQLRATYGSQTPGPTGAVFDIWKLEEWRRASAVRVGRRKEQIATIDEKIAAYWAAGSHWEQANLIAKSTALIEMLTAIQSHLVEKPRSDRREAVLQLASQVMLVLREVASLDENWKGLLEIQVGRAFV